jgi:hypothetical protein
MNKKDIVNNLIKVANHLDNSKDFNSANELTRIAGIVVAMDGFDDMGGFNPDDMSGADDTEALEMELDSLLMDLNRAAQAGELDDEDIQAIQNMLRSNKGLKTNEMSLDDDFELGLGAVPHKRIKNPVDYDETMHDDDDYDISLSDDDDDEDPELNDPFAWQYDDTPDEDDERRDRNHQDNLDGDHYSPFDEDDLRY